MTDKIVVEGMTKVFGPHPSQALKRIAKGESSAAIHEATGNTVAVREVSFSVKAGEIFVIMGLSGSGKSTLVRMLNRLIDPTEGRVLIDGTDVTAMDMRSLRDLRRRDIAMVFQSFALMPHLSALDNAAFGLAVGGMPVPERRERARAALDKVGLGHLADRYPHELSGGQQQRVGLARALAQNPTVLLMDEAFSALDPLIRTEMQDELIRLQEEESRTVVFISHDLDEAMRIGDRIAIMEGGRMIQVGTPDEILRDPADDYVRAFFRGVDVAHVYTAADVARREGLTVINLSESNLRAALERLRRAERDFAIVHDRRRRFRGMVSVESLAAAIAERDRKAAGNPTAQADPEAVIKAAFLPDAVTVPSDASLSTILGTVASAPYPVPVIDAEGLYLGVVSRRALLNALDRGSEDPQAPEAPAPTEALAADGPEGQRGGEAAE
ncbi:glycine betaine/L-proline ABC transporter ATP-binding protein ProV [Tistrella bauzanensis]|uniref:Quaternary amine transport ATP-binding protein n=1 Tax=Tistrella arctica TaxID=3133430 RepID=A0ABU9YIW8_9PROT